MPRISCLKLLTSPSPNLGGRPECVFSLSGDLSCGDGGDEKCNKSWWKYDLNRFQRERLLGEDGEAEGGRE